MKLISLLLCVPLCAQIAPPIPVPPPGTTDATFSTTATARRIVTISVSQQPLGLFIAVLGSRLAGTAGYSVRACSNAPVTFNLGQAAQFIESAGVPVVPLPVARYGADYARKHSKAYKIYSASADVAYGASVAMPLLGVGSLAVRVAAPVIAHYADKFRNDYNASYPDPAAAFAGQFLDDRDVVLQPGSCQTYLFLGGYVANVRTLSGSFEVTR